MFLDYIITESPVFTGLMVLRGGLVPVLLLVLITVCSGPAGRNLAAQCRLEQGFLLLPAGGCTFMLFL